MKLLTKCGSKTKLFDQTLNIIVAILQDKLSTPLHH